MHVSKAFWAAAKLGGLIERTGGGDGVARLVGALQAAVPSVATSLDGRGCSNIWWALATLAQVGGQLVETNGEMTALTRSHHVAQ
jgi:hypothetical protein